ncbi:ferric reductase-like transmembrane protein [Planoprotostelium fungivorum]|uniref:Ferric reductase-like transmembrane protein n=1 Tax=Planoprotostelium fungivorum TaxID=1890364 RepID=A0A2P6MWI3_9EUKA|nr:ferric reductase-like transmembrane protein [Planoprotostelium fungivorum]
MCTRVSDGAVSQEDSLKMSPSAQCPTKRFRKLPSQACRGFCCGEHSFLRRANMHRFSSGLLLLALLAGALCNNWIEDAIPLDQQVHTYTPMYSSGWGLQWTYNNTHIRFTLSLSKPPPGQYVAIGFNADSGMMQGADLIFAYIDNAGRPILLDQYGVGEMAPITDTDGGGKNDLVLISGSNSTGDMIFSFWRKWDTKDSRDAVITPNPINVLWAWGPLTGGNKRFGFHTYYNSDLVQLVNYTAPPTTSTFKPTTSTLKPTTSPAPTTSPSGGFTSGPFSLSWSVSSDVINFTMSSTTGGWVGMGLNSKGQMQGADMMVGWINADNSVTLLDQSSTGHSPPATDAQNDLKLISSSNAGGKTVITFSRKLNTGDSSDRAITSEPVYIVWGVGPQPAAGSQSYSRHTARNSEQHTLYTAPTTSTSKPTIVATKTSAPVTGSSSAPKTTSTTSTPKTTSTTSVLKTTTTNVPKPTISNAPVPTTNWLSGGFTSGPFSLSWSVSGDVINFTMSSSTGGWVGMGLNSQGAMAGADMMVGWINADNSVTLLDQSSTGHSPPATDAHNDLKLISSSNAGGKTVITFSRKLNTGDSSDRAITSEPVYIVWGVGPQPAAGSQSYSRHTARNSEQHNLLIAPTTAAPQPTSEAPVPTTSVAPPAPTTTPVSNGFSEQEFNVNWAVTDDHVTFTMSCPAQNWVGMGLNNKGQMQGADMMVGWINTNGSVTLLDQSSTGETLPTDDASYDLRDVSSSVTDGKTVITFTRKLNTGDSNDYIITEDSLYFLYACGPQPDGQNLTYSYHNHRGSKVVSLYKPVEPTKNVFTKEGYTLEWYIQSDQLHATMSATTDGWVGLGLSSSDTLSAADFIVGWVDDDGVGHVVDQYSVGTDQPINDVDLTSSSKRAGIRGTNDVFLTNSARSGSVTSISFRRNLVTNDPFDAPLSNNSLHIIYASGAGSTGDFSRRSQYGSEEMNLVNYVPPSTSNGFSENGFSIIWSITGDTIHFDMSATTTGWVGIGLNSQNMMQGADMMVGWVDNGNVVLLDQYATGRSLPQNDADNGGANDLTLTGNSSLPNRVSISFSRKLVTQDQHDWKITTDSLYVLYAYGSKFGPGQSYQFHDVWGSKYVNLMSNTVKPTPSSWIRYPGDALAIIVCGSLLLWGLLRLIWFAATFFVFRKTALEDDRRSLLEDSDYDDPSGSSGGESSSINDYRKEKGPIYNGLSDEDTRQPSAPAKRLPPRTYRPIWTGMPFLNRIYGLFISRIPFTHVAVRQLVLILFYFVLNYLVLYFQKGQWTAKDVGSLVAANAFLAVLPATRNSVLVFLTGLPFERTILFHRWVGRTLVALIAAHFIMVLKFWKDLEKDWKQEIFRDNTTLFGFIAGITSIVLLLTSLPIVRRKTWETFFFTHFLFLVFFVFSYLHTKDYFLPYVISSAVIYAIDRFIRTMTGSIPVDTITFRVKNPGGVVQVRFPKPAITRWLHMYRPGQYVFVNFPKVNPFMWHPFSLCSGPDERTGEINIRALGGFTNKVAKHAQENSQTLIRVDGPYGNMNVHTRRHPIVVMVAGGIGITPVFGILRDAYRTGHLSKSQADTIPRHCIREVHLVWTIQSMDQYSWFEEEFEELLAAARHPFQPRLHLHLHVTRDNATLMSQRFKRGRPSFDALFEQLENDHPREAKTVFVCGPKPMVADVWDKVASRCLHGHPYDFHKETFEL